jgi:hypothetical protein
MNATFDVRDIACVRFNEGFVRDTKTIVYKNGTKETIGKWFDIGWELEDLYDKLSEEIKNYNKNENTGRNSKRIWQR